MSAGIKALERLLRWGENSRLRGGDGLVTLPMTQASCPEYAALASLHEMETFRGAIALAEREGLIVAVPNKSGADEGLKEIKVRDLQRLAAHLGVRLLGERSDEAAEQLRAWVPAYPVLSSVLQRWANGKKVRGAGPEAAPLVAAALQAVESRRSEAWVERILRRESVRLFGDSKRLEALTPWLEVLVTGELAATGLRHEDVWAALGLRREPQPMLIAGSGRVVLASEEIPLVRPYLGLPVEAVERIESTADYLMTIENLASFYDAARALPDARGLLIYTAGMPSPAWRALYARVLRALPAHTALYHWGDIDEGGFRIAAALAEVADAAGRRLRPWCMSPLTAGAAGFKPAGEVPAKVLSNMAHWAARTGWDALAQEFPQCPLRFEQESMDPVFPDDPEPVHAF